MSSKEKLQQSLEFVQSKFKMPTKTLEVVPTVSEPLQPHQEELQQLGELAGIHMDVKVFRTLVELLNLGADPNTVYSVLKSIKRSSLKHSRVRLQIPQT